LGQYFERNWASVLATALSSKLGPPTWKTDRIRISTLLYSTAAAAAADKEFVFDGHLHNYIHKRAHQTNMNSNLYGSMKWRELPQS